MAPLIDCNSNWNILPYIKHILFEICMSRHIQETCGLCGSADFYWTSLNNRTTSISGVFEPVKPLNKPISIWIGWSHEVLDSKLHRVLSQVCMVVQALHHPHWSDFILENVLHYLNGSLGPMWALRRQIILRVGLFISLFSHSFVHSYISLIAHLYRLLLRGFLCPSRAKKENLKVRKNASKGTLGSKSSVKKSPSRRFHDNSSTDISSTTLRLQTFRLQTFRLLLYTSV